MEPTQNTRKRIAALKKVCMVSNMKKYLTIKKIIMVTDHRLAKVIINLLWKQIWIG